MDINVSKQILWVVIICIFLYIYAALKDLSNGADDEFEIFLHRYLSRIEKV